MQARPRESRQKKRKRLHGSAEWIFVLSGRFLAGRNTVQNFTGKAVNKVYIVSLRGSQRNLPIVILSVGQSPAGNVFFFYGTCTKGNLHDFIL